MTEGLKSVAKGHQMNRIKKCQIAPEEADAHTWWYHGFYSTEFTGKNLRWIEEIWKIVFLLVKYILIYFSYLFDFIMTDVNELTVRLATVRPGDFNPIYHAGA